MSEDEKNLRLEKVYARALDPVHIGAGGYRLGRVENTVVRDPATNVPKIPGTSIAGIVRAFAEIVKKEDEKKEETEKKLKDVSIEETFGSKPESTETKKGTLRFYDGQIIFFPVSSIQGTVWITTRELLEYCFEEIKDKDGKPVKIPEDVKDKAYAIKGINKNKRLNLGWLLLEVKDPGQGREIKLPQEIDMWVKRIVLVSDKLFSHIVNDNLEVRTSVRIDSTTGTAKARALFTYEAIPRGTVFGFEVSKDNQRNQSVDINKIINAVSPYFKLLGIGGMGTRGFGRLELYPETEA